MTKEAQEFMEEYKKLCDRLQMGLVAVPIFVPTNHGTFEVEIQLQLRTKPSNDNNT